MKILKVILIASQLAFVMCRPQDIRFVQPIRLTLRQVPTESVSIHSNQNGQSPVGFQRVFPQMFALSDREQNQIVRVIFSEIAEDVSFPSLQYVHRAWENQDNPANYVSVVPSEPQSEGQHISRPSAQNSEPVHSPQDKHVANIGVYENQAVNKLQQQHGFVIIPSKQTSQENRRLNQKQEELLPNHQRIRIPGSDVQHELIPIQENQFGQRIPNHGSRIPVEQIPVRIEINGSYAAEEKLPSFEQKVKGSLQTPGSSSTLVAKLTAPSDDPNTSNILMITKKPCVVCCIGNEVEPCKSCCAHTPLLNSQTLKTVLG